MKSHDNDKMPAASIPQTVYVIAGPNGAGKTTFASTFLPEFVNCREFLNADLIAAGLSPFAPETQNVRAGRLMLTRMHELAAAKVSFGFETTLAARTQLRFLQELKSTGYRIELYFLWIRDADTSIGRVQNRVLEGGHDVPETVIRRRYSAGLSNFTKFRILADRWVVYDGECLPQKKFVESNDGTLHIVDAEKYREFLAFIERD